MTAALTRRRALATSAAAALGIGAGVAPTLAASVLSMNDARLVAIAAELQAVDDELGAMVAAHGSVDDLPEWWALVDRFAPLENEMADTPADTLAGVLAKARASQVPPVANCVNGIADSIAADLVRLHTVGRIAHA